MPRIEVAMEPWLNHIQDTWGPAEAEALKSCCTKLLVPYPHPKLKGERTLIIVGERTTIPEQFVALRDVLDAVFNGGRGYIIFSGGITDREAMGEVPAQKMLDQALENGGLPAHLLTRSSVDVASRNTGEQARLFGKMIARCRFTSVITVLPYDHLTRFASVLLKGIELEAGATVAEQTSIIPACYGQADTVPENRSHLVSLGREAFGSHLPDEHEQHLTAFLKQRAGQYTTRWKDSALRNDDPTWTCGAYWPSELLAHLQQQPVQF